MILNNRRAFANDNFYDLQMLFRVLGDLVKENKIISTGKEKAGGRDYEENKWKRTGN